MRAIGLVGSGRTLLKPGSVAFHLKRVLLGQTRGMSNFYLPSMSRTDEIRFCHRLLGCSEAEVDDAFKELEQDRAFVDALAKQYGRVRPDSPIPFSIGRFRVWYAIVRRFKPDVVVETGVHDGLSSTLILRAMARNDRGRLISIDLPSIDLPIGVDGPGWLVPDYLKSRWCLSIGDARQLLPVLAKRYAPIDIFIHDSDHTAEFQEFEYRTVKPLLSESGLLLTDDAIPEMFSDLAEAWGSTAFLVPGAASETGVVLGGIRFRHTASPVEVERYANGAEVKAERIERNGRGPIFVPEDGSRS
jgi:hypothetical protein